jgi:hypothetical protein
MSSNPNKSSKKDKIAKRSQLPVRERAPGVPKHVADYITALIDPYGAEVVSVPSALPYRRTTVKEVKEIDLKDHYVPDAVGAGGSALMEIIPSIDNTINISSATGEAASQISLGGSLSGKTNNGLGMDPTSGYLSRNCIQILHSIDGRSAFYITQVASAQVSVTFDVKDATPSATLFSMTLSVHAAGSWVVQGTQAVRAGVITTMTYTWPADVDGLGFSLTSGDNATYEMTFTITPNAAPGIACPLSINLMTQFSMQLSSKITDLEMYGVSALAVLLTYLGSDLANGGKIYSAWVPIDWSPDQDIGASMSTLAYDKYDGPLKLGTHCHWLPNDLSEITMARPAEAHPTSKKLIIFVIADDREQSTRFRITQQQQYFSQSPAYGRMAYGPSANGLSVALHWLATSVDLCTSNDDHLRKKAMRLVYSGAKNGLNYAIAHPEQLLSALKYAGVALM